MRKGITLLVSFFASAGGAASAQAQSSAAVPRRPVPVAETLRFERACEPAETVIVSAIGDILPHTPLQRQAYAAADGFANLWAPVIPWIEAADIAYGNLEGPAAAGILPGGRETTDPGPRADTPVYTGGSFVFNYHPRIIGDMARSGFDIISLANNHSLDRASRGIDRTIEAFEREGMPSIGTRHSSSDPTLPWHRVTRRNGWNIAWISCSEMTNGIPDPKDQVLLCYRDSAVIIDEIRRLRADPRIDAIIVTPHWGIEYETQPRQPQIRLARQLLDEGADAIFGSHPHVLQPLSKYRTRDGRDTVIAYSLGNFVSNQSQRVGQRLTALVYVGFSRRSAGQRAWVNGVSYVSLWMDRHPFVLNLLSRSTQAPRKQATDLLHQLFDPTRELRDGQRVSTRLECP